MFRSSGPALGLMPTRCRISVDADETESWFLLRSAAVNPPHWRNTIGFSALTRAAEWDDLGAFQEPIEEMGITLRLGIVSSQQSQCLTPPVLQVIAADSPDRMLLKSRASVHANAKITGEASEILKAACGADHSLSPATSMSTRYACGTLVTPRSWSFVK